MKNKWTEFALCALLGYFGAHKFYAGKKGLGFIYLFTAGLCGVGWIVDTVRLLLKALPSKTQEQELPKNNPSEDIVNKAKAARVARVERLKSIEKSKIICLDCETTGLDKEKDEILQLSIIDGNGEILFSDYIKPSHRRTWSKAEAVHGITPAMVKGKEKITQHLDLLNTIMGGAELIVGYNSNEFDLDFLRNGGVIIPDNVELFDVMLTFAPIYGAWDEYHGNYRWQKLTTCARYYGYKFKAHDALEDVRATLHCFYAMLETGLEKKQ